MPSVRSVFLAARSDLSEVNELFVASGLAPIESEQPDQQILALYADGALVGALYACAPVLVVAALVEGGLDVEAAAAAAGRIQAIEALAVAPGHRGEGYGALLLEKASTYARAEFFTETFIAKIDGADQPLIDWYTRRGFTLCTPGQALQVAGVSLPTSPDYRDAWMPLTAEASNDAAA